MGSALFLIGGTVKNALAFSGNTFFSKVMDHGGKKCKYRD